MVLTLMLVALLVLSVVKSLLLWHTPALPPVTVPSVPGA